MANLFYNNLEDYRLVQEKRIEKLKKLKRKTPINAAKYMAAKARQLAPRNTGNLIKNIVRRGNQVRIGGSNPETGFPYVHWINNSEGYERVAYMKRWTGDIKKYSYLDVKHPTGTHRFATIARNSAKQFFRNTMIRDTRKAINLQG
jgi:hypothetical protein